MASISELHPTPHAGPRSAGLAPLRVVLLGLGTVGGGVYQLLARRPDVFDIRRVVVRNRARARDVAVPRALLSTNLWDAINEPAELVIELAGGVYPVGDVVQAALLGGRTVISANKALIARRWRELARFATGVERQLRFSAAVGGEVPVLETVETLGGRGGVASVRAVINGTCNFVLDRLESGATFADAVAAAQAEGFAEADPLGDLSGEDAAYKLQLIARTAFRVSQPLRFEVSGIDRLTAADIAAARAQGRRIRLVASCTADAAGVRGRVAAEALDEHDYLAATAAECNRVEILTVDGERVRLQGKGAGRWPTARSVLCDVYAHLRAQLMVATTRREQHAQRIVALGGSAPGCDAADPDSAGPDLPGSDLLKDQLAFHQAIVTGK